MFNQGFYFSTIRKYVTLFGTLFDDITIKRTDSTGHLNAFIKVPITYSPKEKMLARVGSDSDLDRQTAVPSLPIMAFEMTDLRYDSSRKLSTIRKIAVAKPEDPEVLKYQFNPVPYDFGFRLYVMVKNAEDGTKIVEQILPYFTPDWTTTVHLIPEMEVVMEIPLILNGISQEDVYDGDFKERRSLTWTLDFTMKGYIFGPVKTGKIIKFANSVFYTPQGANYGELYKYVGNTSPVAFIQTRPGLTANGQPTSNSANSIDPNLITATSDFGYIIEKTTNVRT
jgi:hypothetical protein